MKSILIALATLALLTAFPVVVTAEEVPVPAVEEVVPLTAEDIARLVEEQGGQSLDLDPLQGAEDQQIFGQCDQQCQWISYSCSQFACQLPSGAKGRIATQICNSCFGPPGQCDLTNCTQQTLGYVCRSC
jgi:hypothetical protein